MPQRNPLILAKQISSLDRHSSGRFLFGIGTGWLREEVELFGGDFPRRWSQTREALDVMKALWTKEEAAFDGKYFKFPKVRSFPKPAQKPWPPIIIGGMAPKVIERIIAHADGWLPNRITIEELKDKRAEIDARATAAGRDPKAIEISIFGQEPDPDLIRSLLEAGASRVVVRPNHVETEAEMGNQLDEIAKRIF